MSFAHRLRSLHNRAKSRFRAADRRPRELFEGMESRVMLSGETVVVAWNGQYMEVAKDQYIISANAATAAALEQTLHSRGLYATTTVKLGDNVFGFTDTRDAVAQVEAWGLVNADLATGLSPNEVYHKAGTTATEITGSATPANYWQFFNPTVPGADVLGNTNGINAWDIATTGAPSVVAVLDTGMNIASPDFASHLWVNPGEAPLDTVDNDANGVVDDVNGADFSNVLTGTAPTGVVANGVHGNDVSTLIAGTGNNAGGVGVDWNATILPVVVFNGAEDTATDASIIAGLEYVMAFKRKGVNIVAINMSFGRHYLGPVSGVGDVGNGQGVTNTTTGTVAVDQQAISVFDTMKRATGLGMIIVSAAGNGGTNDDGSPFVPANFNDSLGITVAASTINDTLEPTSNYGTNTVKIAAPGSAIQAASGVVTGSSYAAALVSGAIALLHSVRPSLTPQQLVSAVLNGADVVPALTPYVQGGRRLNILHSLETVIGNPAPKGSLDSFDGSVAAGWLFDPNLGSTPVTGQIRVDGVPLQVLDLTTGLTGTTFTAGAVRSDLLSTLGSTNHGFLIRTVLPTTGAHKVQLYVNDAVVDLNSGKFITNTDGSIATLATPVATTQTVGIGNGSVDASNNFSMSGWMLDSNINVTSTTGTITVDGTPLSVLDLNTGTVGTTFTASALRTDLVAKLGSANHGFNIQYVLPAGAHTVNVYVNDSSTDANGNFLTNPDGTRATHQVLLKQLFLGQIPHGQLEAFGPTTASGWMVDANPNATAIGTMLVDGVPLKVLDLNTNTTGLTFTASSTRADLVPSFGTANHGFNFVYVMPTPGAHHVQIILNESLTDANGNFTGVTKQVIINDDTRSGMVHASLDAQTSSTFQGWMVDQNLANPTVTGIVLVDGGQVPVVDLNNNNAVGNTFTANGNRPDLAAFYGSANHGFNIRLNTQLSAGSHNIQVFMLDSVPDGLGGYVTTNGVRATQPVLLSSQVVEGNTLPTGNLDIATTTQIAGWAIDPNTPNGSINVRIDIDGGTVAVVPANGFHSNAVGNHGFFYTPNLSQGSHRVDAYALDDFTGQAVLIGTKTIFQNHLPVASPQGLVYDNLTNTLAGYVVDPDSPFDPVSLQIVVDGNSGGTRQLLNDAADLPDQANFTALNLATPGNNAHGFDLQLPNLVSGNHLIQVYAVDNETGEKTEVVQTPVFVNHLPTGQFYPVNNNLVAEYSANISDPDSPNQPLLYRIDIDNWTGPVRLAPSIQFNVDPTADLIDFPLDAGGLLTGVAQLSVGTHHVKLFAIDNETHELVQITRDFFGNNNPAGIAINVPEVEANPAKLVTGSVDVEATVNGFAYFNDASFLGISGVAHDTGTAETKLPVQVDFFLDGNPVPVLSTFSAPGVGFKWIVTPEELAGVVSPGLHYLQVAAEDPDLSVVDPTTLLTTSAYDVVLAEGEINWPPAVKGGPGANAGAAVLSDVNMQTISGTVAANINDPVPASMANLGAYVPTTSTFRVDINNTQFVTLNPTPAFPEQGINFTVATPQLNSSVGNVGHIYYFDPFIGILRLVAQRDMDQTRVFNFVNKELTVSGNVPPAGNLDSVTSTQIAGWVRDADTPGQQIQYRLDFDDSTGLPDTALLLRPDLPFPSTNNDQEHGFSVTPPVLKAGAHTVKLWAIDPVTQQAYLISQRSFTVQDDSNKRPIGSADVITGDRIAGWVQDPTTPTTAVVIEVRIDGSSQGGFGGFFPTTFFRTDVVRNGSAAYGFDFAMPSQVPAGQHLVQVYAVDTTDQSRRTLLKETSVQVGTPQISGNFDIADFTQIAGWGRAAANDEMAPKFRMDVNGVAFQTFTGTASLESGMKLWRFDFPTPPLGLTTNNTVTLYYIDPHTSDAILVATKVIGPVQPTTGTIDVANASVVQGWAQSPSLPGALITVDLVIDNVTVGTTTASLDRPDLTDQRAGHAYQFNVPTLAPGTHTLAVKFLDPITGEFSVITSSQVLTT